MLSWDVDLSKQAYMLTMVADPSENCKDSRLSLPESSGLSATFAERKCEKGSGTE